MMFLFYLILISLASVCVQADSETKRIGVPPYTKLQDSTLLANVVIRNVIKKKAPTTSAELLKIYIAVIDLADQVAKKGENTYTESYMKIAKNALKQVNDNPTVAEDKLWNLVNNTNKELEKIVTFVLLKQLYECVKLISYDCDLIISEGIKNDPDLKQRANLLVAGGKQGEIFLEISNRFKIPSKNEHYDAEQFLFNHSDVMKPLVLAAYETQKVVQSLKR